MRSAVAAAVVLLVLLGGGVDPAAAQSLTGQLSGSVFDSSGGALPGAIVTVRNTATSVTREVTTDGEGQFVIPNIVNGTYDLRIMMSGFTPYEQTGIVVSSTERVSLPPIVLQVGGFSEAVTVAADTVRAQTQSGERSATISAEEIADRGMRGRVFIDALKTLPGVVDTGTRESPGWGSLGGMTINGNGNFNFSYDGVTNKDTGSNSSNYAAPALDSIAELKVQASNFQAEYGRTSGATIVVVTKSGSARFSGSAAYYKRHEAFNANTWDRERSCRQELASGATSSAFCATPRYRYNNIAWTVGGPVLVPGSDFNQNRDKLFFFFSQDLLPRTDPLGVQSSTVPTVAERNGDFSQTVNAAGALRNIRDPLTGKSCNVNSGGAGCFAGNIIPQDRINPLGQAMLNLFPLPNATDPTGNRQYNYQYDPLVTRLRREQVVRIDYNIRPGTTFYTRAQFGHEINYRGYGSGAAGLFTQNGWPQMQNSYDVNTWSLASTLIHTFTPTTVLEVIGGVNWSEQVVYPLTTADLESNQWQNVLPQHRPFFPEANPLQVLPNIQLAGTNSLNSTAGVTFANRYPFTARNPIQSYTANLTHVRGSHNLKAGIFIEHTARPAQRASSFNATYNFQQNNSNPLSSNMGWSNALLGLLNSYTESTAHPYAEGRFNQIEFFVQDNWRIARTFTLDYGLRMNYIGPTFVKGQQVSYFDPAEWDPAQAPVLYDAVCSNGAATCSGNLRVAHNPLTGEVFSNSVLIGAMIPGSGNPYNGMVVADGTPPAFKNQGLKPSPRVGFGWDVTGDGKTAVRGGYGINYERYGDDTVLSLIQNAPLMNTYSASWLTVDALQGLSQFTLSPVSTNAFAQHKPQTVHNWSVSVQRELPFALLADVAYVGNVTRDISRNVAINDLTPELATSPIRNDPTQNNTQLIDTNFFRAYRGYAGISERRIFAEGPVYHSIQVSLTRRMTNGFGGSIAYTGSRRTQINGWTWFLSDAENEARWASANGSRPHNLVFNYNWMIPGGARFLGDSMIARGVLDGWQISGVTTMQGGTRQGFSFSWSGAPSGDLTQGLGDSRVNIVCDPNLPRGERTFERQFRTECIRPPGPLTDPNDLTYRGTSTSDEWVSLGYVNHDITFLKNFAMPNRHNFQIRIELYNAFNSTQYQAVDTSAEFNFATGEQTDPNFGSVTGVRNNSNRVMQLAARFTF